MSVDQDAFVTTNPYAAPLAAQCEPEVLETPSDDATFAGRRVQLVAHLFRGYAYVILGVLALMIYTNVEGRVLGQNNDSWLPFLVTAAISLTLSLWYLSAASRLIRFETSVKFEAIVLSCLIAMPCFVFIPLAALSIYRIIVYLKPELPSQVWLDADTGHGQS